LNQLSGTLLMDAYELRWESQIIGLLKNAKAIPLNSLERTKMKKVPVISLVVFASLLLTSCSQVQPAAILEPTNTSIPIRSSTPTFTEALAATTTPLHTNTPEPTFTTTPTFLPLFPVVKEWSTYTFPFGDVVVSIQYPVDWQVSPINNFDQINFYLDSARGISRNYGYQLQMYKRPIADRHVTDPHTWEPNEGGYKVLWEKPLKVGDLTGVEFVWGGPYLYGILYSQKYELDIRLAGELDHIDEKDVIETGYDNIIQEHFQVYEYMLQSIRVQDNLSD
jgi:hypothetical protein